MNQDERVRFLTDSLLREGLEYAGMEEETDPKRLLRGLMNIRPARETPEEVLSVQDEYLREETEAKGIADYKDLTPVRPGIYLYKGDITALRCDAIVNAAKSSMAGCITPNHTCIDNCIHTYAGMELRQECREIVRREGILPPGEARVTGAYNLPCRYIVHTVGPKVFGELSEEGKRTLRSCYTSSLKAAEGVGAKSLAFCCIGTGVFNFPREEAARIAVSVVGEYIENSVRPMDIIFAVYTDEDLEIYEKLLK